ncbi:hypothetical protein GCM10009117_22660 [Gangjinia marincola]|uniref:HMA domain-containing protein n=2 Tax=Gangjinia marincola TaxID=578463 RepID=A0ABN1MIX9_9FLAO
MAAVLLGVAPAHAQKERDQFMVQVDGLGCPFCAYGLEKKFKEFKGIKDVKIDIETGDFSFSYPSEKALTLEAVEQQVIKAGYTPMSGKVTRADGSVQEMNGTVAVAEGDAALTNASFKVGGKCGMCENRILKAVSTIEGAFDASWDQDSKQFMVKYDASKTSEKEIQQTIAKAGHDTPMFKAKDDVYTNLPPCCNYERLQ